MRFLVESEIRMTEQKTWQEQQTKRQVLLASLPQQPKWGYVFARIGAWFVVFGIWMQQGKSEAAV